MQLRKEDLGDAGEYATNRRYFTYVASVSESQWELDGTQLPTRTTVSEYEEPRLMAGTKQWGNLTRRQVVLSDGHATETVNTFYTADETTWTLGRIERTTVKDTRPAQTLTVSPPAEPSIPATLLQNILPVILSTLLDD